ncbi:MULTISPECIES: DUF6409 family protein [Streptomycetaceae]|uniref:DUF6409 family protein n=1 Tax=Streptomycetaceae TaxID=2062 RepID=UPI00300B2294
MAHITRTPIRPKLCADSYAPGTLVATDPLPQYPRIPARSGVVVSPWGSTVLVWFWGLGQPMAGRSVHAIFPQELMPLGTTLATMPEGAFQAIERGVTPVRVGGVLPDTMAPLTTAVEAARAERDRRQ